MTKAQQDRLEALLAVASAYLEGEGNGMPDTALTAADLRTAVRKLTVPTTTETLMRRYEKRGRELIIIHHDPLITQLARGTSSAGAGDAFGGSDPRTRSIFDADVVEKMSDLHRDVTRSWNHLLPAASRVLPLHRYRTIDALALWHELFEHYADRNLVTPARIAHEARIYQSWVTIIETKFDPPKTIEGIAPCPKCSERWATPDELGDMKSAIVYTFTGLAAAATATCRACGNVWKGPKGLEALTRQQDARHAENISVLQNEPPNAL